MSWLTGLFGFFRTVAGLLGFLRDRHNREVGRTQERVETQAEVIEDAEQANRARLDTGDSDRAERLRDRFTRD